MAEAQNPLRRLRSDSLHFLGLKEEDILPPGGLTTNKNMFKVILKQKMRENKTPVENLVCCSLTKTFYTKCGESGGCQSSNITTQPQGALLVRSWKDTPRLAFQL